ncbi:MAG: 2-keto-3-deoxygluconate kinase [Proteobacteria bacterium]|nr:MAG: 2-keto-3-deoxygluconate kinase [Pseudomonadota bacterium]
MLRHGVEPGRRHYARQANQGSFNVPHTVVCFGEVLLRLSAPGKQLLLQSPTFDAHVGGAEANVAVALSRLGHRARMVSTLADSSLGQACAAELRRHGVDLETIRYGEGRMGLYFLTHGAGQRPAEVLYDRGDSAFALSSPEAYDWPVLLTDALWLHLSGITPAVSASAADAALAAVDAARARGVRVSFDCNFRARLWGARARQAPAILKALCERADVIFGDQRDVAFILGNDAGTGAGREARERAARVAFETFPHLSWMANTERRRQSVEIQELTGWLHGRDATYCTRPYPLNGIVDRIGAGDAFAAGVLHGLIAGLDPQGTIEFGTAAACLKHSIPGDFNLIGRADIEALLNETHTDVRR